MKKILITLSILLATAGINKAQEKVNWLTFEEAEAIMKTDPKPVFIDSYTDWCSYCKKLDKNTLSNPVIKKYINDNFHAIKFNAESKEPITFLGKEFINDGKSGRTHQLALALLVVDGKIGYPTLVFFNEKWQLITQVPGYMGPKDFEPLLVYFGEKKYESTKFDDFKKSFVGKVE